MKNQWQNNNNYNDVVKFDGYNVKKEGAERLSKLRGRCCLLIYILHTHTHILIYIFIIGITNSFHLDIT